jgi:hypothetical protein
MPEKQGVRHLYLALSVGYWDERARYVRWVWGLGDDMEPVNLLVVERGADWAQWAVVSQLLGQAVLVLIQQGDESSSAFRERIAERVQRVKAKAIDAVVLLRGKKDPATRGISYHRRLLHELGVGAKNGLKIYPQSIKP